MSITQEQANTLLALTRVHSTRRVRYYAVQHGTAGPNETLENTERLVEKTRKDLEDFVQSLVAIEVPIQSQFEGNGNDFIEP